MSPSPPAHDVDSTKISGGIAMLEASLADVCFGGVPASTMNDLMVSTYLAIGDLESLKPNLLPTIPIPIEMPTSSSKRKNSPELPLEIVMHILSFLRYQDQKDLGNACKVSRTWYHAGISRL